MRAIIVTHADYIGLIGSKRRTNIVLERLREAIETLSPRQKTVFTLKHFEELSIPEIAELTGLDTGTVKSHLFRAAHKIRERLRDLRKKV